MYITIIWNNFLSIDHYWWLVELSKRFNSCQAQMFEDMKVFLTPASEVSQKVMFLAELL